MTEKMTDEQLRNRKEYLERISTSPFARDVRSEITLITELLALRAERARPNDAELVDQIQSMQEDLETLRAERAKLEAALRGIAREQSAKTPTEAADKFQGIARAAINWKPIDLAQPAESGATE